MGIVKKQVYKNTLISYIGMVLGYVNVLFYTQFLSTKQYGLYILLGNLSVLYSLIASMGVPSIITRFFPFFKTEDGRHNDFFYWVGRLMLWSFLIVTLIYVLIKPVIVSVYLKQSPLFIGYFYVIIPFAAFVIFYNFLEASGRVIYRSVYSAFLKEVLLKVFTTAAILVYFKGWIDFRQFILIYVALNGIISVLLLISLIVTGRFKFGLRRIKFEKGKSNEIINYGLFALLSSSVYVLWQKMDVVMLSAMAGLSITAVYGFYSSIALVINVPSAALSRTTYQIVADSWKSKNMRAIATIYNKTSIIQMTIGCLLFIGIIINRNNLIQIIHKKEYGDHFNLFIIIALGFLIDITGGLNAYIIVTSHKYRLYTVLVIIASIVCIGLTYSLIPLLSGMGAAIAYLITISAFNFCTWFYIKYRFNMQPFTYKHLLVIVISVVGYFAGEYFWRMPNLYLDILVRSCFTAAVYGACAYFLQISEDLNEKADKIFVKLHIIKN